MTDLRSSGLKKAIEFTRDDLYKQIYIEITPAVKKQQEKDIYLQLDRDSFEFIQDKEIKL